MFLKLFGIKSNQRSRFICNSSALGSVSSSLRATEGSEAISKQGLRSLFRAKRRNPVARAAGLLRLRLATADAPGNDKLLLGAELLRLFR